MNACGDWRLDREIGRGAYGVVYIATNGKGERAAVKVCRREEGGEERYARELRGAKLYSAIPPQEGLVRIKELAEEPWGFYAVMDLADDEFGRWASGVTTYRPKTLASVIEGEKALPLGECVKLGISLAKGLAALQRHHLLHRDIKPGNVVYVGSRPVLTDPGLIVEEDKAASLVGTPGYVPPENCTAAVGDIYSLGLTLKAASFGRRVEDLDKGPSLEADTGARYFPAWWRILNKATDEDHDRRYQSARALLRDLDVLRSRMALESANRSCLAKFIISLAFFFVVVLITSRIRPHLSIIFDYIIKCWAALLPT
ncbi:MAG: protein kinase [Kiritimatiellae bacterium]|nr:protein kinase [Kiritimatiellia bacterium]